MDQVEYRFLDVPEEINSYLAAVRREPLIALDFEADGLHSYREKVCLAQFSTPGENVVVDPLADRSALTGLGTTLADPEVEKVFHGGDYDIRLLKKDYGFEIHNVFDTMIAAQFTGRDRFGLAALLEEYFGVRVDKKYQRADWSSRPLRRALLAYAALDTAYLLPLRAHLIRELEDLGRLGWVQEELTLLAGMEPTPPKRPWCLDVKGARKLHPRQLAILQALLEVRDGAARRWDRPPFKVLSNEVLLTWAVAPPTTTRKVMETASAGRRVLSRLAEQIVEAIRKADTLPPERCPKPTQGSHVPLAASQEKRLNRLKKVRTRIAGQLELPAGLLVNTATLERIARHDPDDMDSCLDLSLKRWQLEAVGNELAKVVAR